MSDSYYSSLDNIYEDISHEGTKDEEILSKLFTNVTNFANLSPISSSFDQTLFNEQNSPNQKKIITACLLRLLCNNYNLIWDNTTLRLKICKFFDKQMVQEYKILGIKIDDDNHIKLSKLRDIEENLFTEFDIISDSLVTIEDISEFRKNFMKALKNPLYKTIIDVFCGTQNNEQRINAIFDSAKKYINSPINDQFILFQNFNDHITNYLTDVNNNISIVTSNCVMKPIKKLYQVLYDDFNCKDAIKSTILEIEELDRKYQFSIKDNKLHIKFLVKNLGPGYAFDVKVEIQDVEGLLTIEQSVKNYGELGPSNLQVVFEANVNKVTKENVGVFVYLSWKNFDKKLVKKEYIFYLKSQKNNLNWEYLKSRHPYSLEAVETEEELVGRNEVVSNLYTKLTAQKVESSIIFGQKRVGKTSIAQTIHNKIKNLENFTSVFIKMGDIDKTTSSKLVSYLGNEIINELSYINEFKGISRPEFEGALAPLIRYFKDIKHIYPNNKFVIILDEFDEIPSEFYHSTNIGDTFFHNIRSLSSEGNIGFVLVGGENMQIIKQSTDKLNKFYTFRVDYFDKSKIWEDFQDLIRRPVKESFEFSDDSILKLYEMTEGNPFFTKLICQNIYKSMCDKRNSYVTEDEVETAIIETIDSMDINHINHFWKDGLAEDDSAQRDNIETQRRKFLIAFANIKRSTGENLISKKELSDNDLLKNSVAVNEMINSFLNREILIEEDRLFRIKPKFIEKWLVEKGSKLISTAFLNESAIIELNRKESELYVSDKEILTVCNLWGLFRGNKITPTALRAWLDQFKNNKEKRLMFKLVKKIRLYDEVIIREKLRILHSTVKSKIVYEIVKGQKSRHDILLSCFGAPSKSGPSYARLYAHENEVIANNVIPIQKIGESIENNKSIKALVLIDDIIGSGDTYVKALRALNTDFGDILYKNGIKLFICSICALDKGIHLIEKEAKKVKFEVYVKAADVLDLNDQCFNKNAEIFEDQGELEEAKKIVLDYGRKLKNKLPLGYDNCELLVVFKDNCPDNTLNIIWDTSVSGYSWIPLFERIE